jgi:hypothetical protein
VSRVYTDTREKYPEMPELVPDTLEKATDALCGLAAFPIEQSTAESLSKAGLGTHDLWERKRQAIEQTPGLSVPKAEETLADIRGCKNAITFMERLFSGEEAPRCIVLIDEINDAMAGSERDSSGVSQEMHGTLLSWMNDEKACGIL